MEINKRDKIVGWIAVIFALIFMFSANTHGSLSTGFPVTDGLSVYLDAESVERNGNHVMGMLDRSGNENHAWEVVAPPPSMPTLLESATPSGLDAVRFDGVGGYAEVPGNPEDFDGRARTVFVVARAEGVTAGAAAGAGRLMNTAYKIIDSWEPANTQPNTRHRTTDIWLQSGGVFGVNVRNPLGDWVDVRLSESFSEGEFFIGVQEWKSNGDLFAHTRNAANETVSGDAIGGMAEPEGHLHTRIGAGSETRNTRVMDFFGGEVSAVLIYNRQLSASERVDVELYLHGAYLDSGAAGEGPGDPPVLDGLVLHLNAMNLITDGDFVTELVDVSGRGNNAIAYVHDPKPGFPTLVGSATPTGQDAVRFDGISGYAEVGSNPEDFDGRAKTTIAVFRPTHLAGSEYLTNTAYEILDPSLSLEDQSNLRTRTNWIRAFGADGGVLRVSQRNLSGGHVGVDTPNGSIRGGEFFIGINQWRENGDLASILRNGNNERFEGVGSGADAEPSGHIHTRLGVATASGDPDTPDAATFFEGEIAAFLIYNRELSASELEQVESYLHDTYFGAGPGSEGPGNPPVVDGLVLHLNGSSVLMGEGDIVTDLLDTSGRGNHAETFFYQAPRDGGPTLIASGTPSGRPSVRFDGNLQYLEIGSSPAHFDGWGKTTMAVFKADRMDGRVLNTAYEEVAPGLAPSGRTRFGELQPWANNNRLRANNRTATGGFIGANTPNQTLFAGEYYLGINHAKDNGETVAILRNAANERFEGTNQGDPANPQGHLYTRVGAGSGFGNTGLDMFFGGDVAAVVVFNRELSPTELEQVEEFLYNRYLKAESPGGSYSNWISSFDIPPGLEGPDADASGDGVANLIKFAVGLNPTVSTREGLPTISTEIDNELSYLTITVDRDPDAGNLNYIIEGSVDLIEWSSDSVVIDVNDPAQLRARLAAPLETEAKGFLRLRVLLEE